MPDNYGMTNSKLRQLVAAVALMWLACSPLAGAQEPLTPPEQRWEELLTLAQAYQSNYFELVAICTYQLYASTGIVATDFANGYIDSETALTALDANSLLQSSCFTTLTQIIELTPADDEELHAEAARLLAIITAEGQLLGALRDVCVDPSEANAVLAEEARSRVEELLNEYTGLNLAPADDAAADVTR